jgi:hypothetical protein
MRELEMTIKLVCGIIQFEEHRAQSIEQILQTHKEFSLFGQWKQHFPNSFLCVKNKCEYIHALDEPPQKK